ncbi:YoaK family protein [Actinomycetospora rhizophila]|uniref:YoaK family protein n=1 Tax=Actinomycetospora rhizophila TaxID=1416876 RepID=A0ABV9ZMZ2_9PSEU
MTAPTGRWALRRALVDDRDGPLPAMLVALTCLAGVVDATSILALDHVFVAAVTGNIVFLGIALAGAGGSIVAPSVAVGGFVVGALVGARVVRRPGGHRGRAVRDVAGFKLLLAVPVTVLVLLAAEPMHPAARLTVTALLAASMGGQLALIRYLKVPDLLTAVLTLTTIGILTERGAGHRDPFALRRGLALLAFVVGVVAGALLCRLVAPGAALTLGLAIIVGVAVGSHAVSRAEAPWTAPR